MSVATDVLAREQIGEQRYEAYQQWERLHASDPRFATTRMLIDDIRAHGHVRPETMERVDVEERTWAAEILNAPHSHIDRFLFDGRDVIVKETDGLRPRLTLRDVYQNGLEKTRADVEREPGLDFQLKRDELFLEFYEAIEMMMHRQGAYRNVDTIQMISTCPVASELTSDIDEAVRLLNSRFYNLEQRKAFDYTARRLADGRLELSATRLDSSDLEGHAAVLQTYGHADVDFRSLPSHQYGQYLTTGNTTHVPIEVVIAARVSVYDEALEAKTGKKHRFGRTDDKPDAHEFFDEHCGEYWAGYLAYNDLLAQHLAGQRLHSSLQKYLLKCLDGQQQAGHSVLSQDKLNRLRVQLQSGSVTMDMAMNCRELLVYDHHATMTRLYGRFVETGSVEQLEYTSDGDFMDSYADAASSNGIEAAVNGEAFAGCETATAASALEAVASGAGSIASAAELARKMNVTLEQALRIMKHCEEIRDKGFTIHEGVQCPCCEQKVNATETVDRMTCNSCGSFVNKATGELTRRPGLVEQKASGIEDLVERRPRLRLEYGRAYQIGAATYVRQQLIIVGGAHTIYVDEAGSHIGGREAEALEAAILQQLSAEIPEE